MDLIYVVMILQKGYDQHFRYVKLVASELSHLLETID